MNDISKTDNLAKIVSGLLDGLKEKGTLTQADIETILAQGKAA